MSITGRSFRALPLRRASVAYLLAIVVPTLALCYLGLSSIDRQRRALDALAVANARLTVERLVGEIETRAASLAEALLRGPDLAAVDVPVELASPALRRQLRARLDRVRVRHPIARALVVFRGDHLLVPEPANELPRRLDQLLAAEPPALSAQFERLFTRAESLELRALQPERARPLYERASDLSVSDELRALALARSARCSAKANDVAGAKQTYRTLLTKFSDQYDLFNSPYGIVAALELDERERADGAPRTDALTLALRNLADGRWELTAEAAEYYQRALAGRLGHSGTASTGPYVDYLALADVLQRHARPPGLLKAQDVAPIALVADGHTDQVFYARVAGAPGRASDLVVGLVVDLRWVTDHLMPSIAGELRVSLPYRVGLRAGSPAPPDSAAAALVPFRTVFPFWTMEGVPASVAAPGGMMLFVGATLAVLAVLLLGVVLLVRDAAREASTARLRSGFVSGVSHELKTPLTLIRMYGEMLHDDLGAPQDERQGYSAIITRESERLTRLIDRVLDFSRAERGTKKYTLARVGLAPVIERTIAEYEPFLRQKGFVVEPHLGEVGPVDADADAVREAILNLLDNAAKYSGESRCITVRLMARPGEVVAEVEDHGIGFDNRMRARLFQPFERGEHHDGTGGYGLGLYLVKHIMDAHAGRVEVDTAPGAGSSFRLVFPAPSAFAGDTGQQARFRV